MRPSGREVAGGGGRTRGKPMMSSWPPLSPVAHLRRSRGAPPFPLGRRGCRLFARARHGLVTGLAALGVAEGRCVLMPAWHHGSEVEAVRSVGATCVFYDVDPTLAPDEQELDRLLTPEVAALHLTHFLGFPQDAARWRAWCDERGVALIEDAAQAWLTGLGGVPVGSHGDLTVFCLYKTCGLPDGAAATWEADGEVDWARTPGGSGAPALLRRHAAWLVQRGPRSARGRRARYDASRDMAVTAPAAPSAATRWLLPRLAVGRVAELRRRNYAELMDSVGHLVPSPFDVLVEGAVPLVLPVAVPDKEAVVAEFGSAGVGVLDLWSLRHPSCHGDYPRSEWLRHHLVGLPVHQELTRANRTRLARLAAGLLADVSPVAGIGPAGSAEAVPLLEDT